MFYTLIFSKFSNLSQLKKNVLSGVISAGVSFILLLIAYPIYLKYLGSELYGLWAAISIVVFFSRLGNLGINNALIKYVAEKFGLEEYDSITQYITTSFIILIVPSILILLLLFLFNEKIIVLLNLNSDYTDLARILIPMTGILSVFILFVELIKGILMSIGRVDMANYIFLLGRFLQVIVSISLIIAGNGIWGLYCGNVAFYLVAFCIYLYFLRYRYGIEIFKFSGFRKNYMQNLLTFGGTMFSASIISMLMEPFNKIIISRYIGLSEVSYYEIGLRGATQLRSLYETGLRAIMPKVSEVQQKAQNFRMIVSGIYKKSITFIILCALPVFGAIFILGGIILPLWLNNRYDYQILTALRWFLFGYMINLLSVPSFYIFSGINKVHLCFYAAAIRSLGHFIAIIVILGAGITISFNHIIAINSFAVISAALFLIATYYLKIDKYAIQPA